MTNQEKAKRIQKHLSRYAQMLQRCYNSECMAYKNYGAKGITVCDEWLNSPDTFIAWCENNGYSEELVLDKDILSDKLGISPKIYSPQTCQFITEEENREYMLNTQSRQAVASYDKLGNLVASYKSISNAEGTELSNISRAVRGERLTAGGYYWRHINSIDEAPLKIVPPKIPTKGIPIVEVDSEGTIINSYSNCVEAARLTGLKTSSISQVANGNRPSLFGRFFKKVNG